MKKKKTISYKKHQERKRNISGRKVIRIDAAKEKHQITVIGWCRERWRKPPAYQIM